MALTVCAITSTVALASGVLHLLSWASEDDGIATTLGWVQSGSRLQVCSISATAADSPRECVVGVSVAVLSVVLSTVVLLFGWQRYRSGLWMICGFHCRRVTIFIQFSLALAWACVFGFNLDSIWKNQLAQWHCDGVRECDTAKTAVSLALFATVGYVYAALLEVRLQLQWVMDGVSETSELNRSPQPSVTGHAARLVHDTTSTREAVATEPQGDVVPLSAEHAVSETSMVGVEPETSHHHGHSPRASTGPRHDDKDAWVPRSASDPHVASLNFDITESDRSDTDPAVDKDAIVELGGNHRATATIPRFLPPLRTQPEGSEGAEEPRRVLRAKRSKAYGADAARGSARLAPLRVSSPDKPLSSSTDSDSDSASPGPTLTLGRKVLPSIPVASVTSSDEDDDDSSDAWRPPANTATIQHKLQAAAMSLNTVISSDSGSESEG